MAPAASVLKLLLACACAATAALRLPGGLSAPAAPAGWTVADRQADQVILVAKGRSGYAPTISVESRPGAPAQARSYERRLKPADAAPVAVAKIQGRRFTTLERRRWRSHQEAEKEIEVKTEHIVLPGAAAFTVLTYSAAGAEFDSGRKAFLKLLESLRREE